LLPAEARWRLAALVGWRLVERVELEHARVCAEERVEGTLDSLLALIYFRLGVRPGRTGWERVP
jgi:hypothetical protein